MDARRVQLYYEMFDVVMAEKNMNPSHIDATARRPLQTQFTAGSHTLMVVLGHCERCFFRRRCGEYNFFAIK